MTSPDPKKGRVLLTEVDTVAHFLARVVMCNALLAGAAYLLVCCTVSEPRPFHPPQMNCNSSADKLEERDQK